MVAEPDLGQHEEVEQLAAAKQLADVQLVAVGQQVEPPAAAELPQALGWLEKPVSWWDLVGTFVLFEWKW